MGHSNSVTEFVLLGLTQDPGSQKALVVIFLLICIVTMVGNLLIVVTILTSPSLGSPMYLFLITLSLMDAVYAAVISPKLITDLLCGQKTISFLACMGQLFLEHFFGGIEVFLLVAMAYDRYVAICKPLHYINITNSHVCILLLVLSWAGGFVHSVVQLLCTTFPLVAPMFDHFDFDKYPLLELDGTDTYFLGLTVVANSGVIYTVIFICLLMSCGVILSSLKTHSQEGRRKALPVVFTSRWLFSFLFFVVPRIFMYVRPVSNFPVDKFISVAYIVTTPMLNPLIYTLRNSEMTNAMKKVWCKKLAKDRMRLCHLY